MTRYEKIAISLPMRAAESVRRAVRRGDAPSVSAYVAEAVEEKAKHDDLAALLDEMLEETGGPMTPAEKRAIDRVIDFENPPNTPPEKRRYPRLYLDKNGRVAVEFVRFDAISKRRGSNGQVKATPKRKTRATVHSKPTRRPNRGAKPKAGRRR
jgi:hypothetical protein